MESASMRFTLERLHLLSSRPPLALFLQGEPGTGRKTLARYFHFLCFQGLFLHSFRDGSRMMYREVDCSQIPPEEQSSFFFGADGMKGGGGLFREALSGERAGGSFFLENIHLLSPDVQRRLRELAEETLSVSRRKKKDSPLLLMTSLGAWKGMGQDSTEGPPTGFDSAFAELFFRNRVELPPLRERRDDIPVLTEALLRDFSRKTGRNLHGVSDRVLSRLLNHPWPGNVAELKQVLETAAMRTDRALIREIFLLPPLLSGRRSENDFSAKAKTELPGKDSGSSAVIFSCAVEEDVHSLAGLTRAAVQKALHKTNGNKSRAAALLGIHRSTLYRKLGRGFSGK